MVLNKIKLLSPQNDINLSLEDIADGLSRLEKEYVWYGQIEDATFFEGRDFLYQEQCNFKNNGTSVRVRKEYSISGNSGEQIAETAYTLTLKQKQDGHDQQSCSEVTTVISKDFFDAFCLMCDEKMIKRRYELERDGFKYEIDVATQENRPVREKDYVKVDIEVGENQSSESIPKNIPGIELKVIADKQNQTEEEKSYVDNIHRNYLSVKIES